MVFEDGYTNTPVPVVPDGADYYTYYPCTGNGRAPN